MTHPILSQTSATERIRGYGSGVAVKAPVRIVTTVNLTLSGEQTVNSVAVVDGDRVLVKDQSDATQNGIYVVSTSDWQRSADFDGDGDVVQGTLVVSTHDTTIFYRVTTANPITIGSSSLSFASVSAALTQAIIGQVLYPQTSSEASAGITPTNYHYPPGYVYRYGTNTTPGTTDMLTPLNNAITVAHGSGVPVKLPPERIRITDTPTSILGQVTIEGDGPYKSRIDLIPTADNKAALKLSNGASRCERVILRDFAIWSNDTTYTKIGLDLYDLSVCKFERIFIYGTGGSGPSAGACFSGNGSIGIRTHGRDATGIDDVEIIADKPIVIAANPNIAASEGEDMDHWQWNNLYLVGNGNPLIEVEAGLGLMETRFEGYQAWVGGTTGFKINDTRVAPTVPSRGITFKNVRREQGTDTNAYVFDMTFSEPVQRIQLEDVLMGTGSHGITINGFTRLLLNGVTAALASGKNSIVTAGVTAKTVLSMTGCIWQSGTNVTLTGLTQILAGAYRSADYAGPSDAIYAGQITDTSINAEQLKATCANGAVGLDLVAATGDRFRAILQAAGTGVELRALNNAATDYEPAVLAAETFDLKTRTGAGTVASAVQADANASAGNTRLLIYDVDNGQIERVSVGASDSGGAGFKVLRIPN